MAAEGTPGAAEGAGRRPAPRGRDRRGRIASVPRRCSRASASRCRLAGRHPDGRPARAAPRTSRRSSARSTRPGCAVEALELVQPTLDDVFVEKTGRHLEGAEEHSPRPRRRLRRERRGSRAAAGSAARRRDPRGRGARAALGAAGLPPPAVPGADHHLPVAVPGGEHRRRRARRRPAAVPRRCTASSTSSSPGAMLQSTMLAGVSAAIALALDIEIGFIDRLVAAPIARVVVRARAAGGDGRAGADRGRSGSWRSGSCSARRSRAASRARWSCSCWWA